MRANQKDDKKQRQNRFRIEFALIFFTPHHIQMLRGRACRSTRPKPADNYSQLQWPIEVNMIATCDASTLPHEFYCMSKPNSPHSPFLFLLAPISSGIWKITIQFIPNRCCSIEIEWENSIAHHRRRRCAVSITDDC